MASDQARDAQSTGNSQDEGVLADVLEELDRERSKRAELEAKIRKLTEDNRPLQSKTEHQVSRQAFLAMQAEVEGYRQIIDALTIGKPAIANASKSSIPLHALRLLEVLPWDPRAKEHVFETEVLYEWQVYDTRENKWQNNLRYFPSFFKSLPVEKPTGSGFIHDQRQTQKDRNLLVFLAGSDKPTAAPSKHGTLTDEHFTKVYNIEAGYPLPQDKGTWEWIGGWRIEKHIATVDGQIAIARDDNGWSYATKSQDFFHKAGDSPLFDNPGLQPNAKLLKPPTTPLRKFRRRKWMRRRILIDYPYACEGTKQYLSLLAENARLTVTVNKVTDQLVETKMLLTEIEESLTTVKSDLKKKNALLRAVGLKDESLDDHSTGSDDGVNIIQEFLSRNEQQVKDIGSKISQWVSSARKMSEDGSTQAGEAAQYDTNGENIAGAAALDGSQDGKFDWKMIGRGALLERIKPSQHPAQSENKASAKERESPDTGNRSS